VPFPSRSGKWQISTGGGTNPIWSPLGKEIYFTQGQAIFAVTVRTGSEFDYSAARKILDFPPDGSVMADISRDGKRFAILTLPSAQLNTSEVTLVSNWFQELKNAFSGK
jgi:Tol biopolymer transport system component